MDLSNPPKAEDGPAREMRDRTIMRATMFGDRMPEQDIIIKNASPHGIGAVSKGLMPEIGEEVCVTLPYGDEVSGIVRWIQGKAFGVQLEDELDLHLLKLTTHRRNEEFGKAIDWLVDQRFREPEIEEEQRQENRKLL